MDLTTIIGLVLGVFSLVGGFIFEGGHPGALLAPTAALIVFGGTFGAVAVGVSMEDLKNMPKWFSIAFQEKHKIDITELIQRLAGIADRARREGLLSLEQELPEIEDNFLRQGLQLIIDGTDPELTRNMLETEMFAVEERHKIGIGFFEAAGGYAPTMGIIGTVMGLVHVLGNLSDPSSLGPSIATAFIATLYGVASANVAWLPIATKLKKKSHHEKMVKEMVMEGVLSIQAGENPTIIREKLLSFLTPIERAKLKQKEE